MLIKAKRAANIYCTPTKLGAIFQLCHLSVTLIFLFGEETGSLCWATFHSGVVSLCTWCLGLIMNNVPLHSHRCSYLGDVLYGYPSVTQLIGGRIGIWTPTVWLKTHILNHYGINMFVTKFSWGKKEYKIIYAFYHCFWSILQRKL